MLDKKRLIKLTRDLIAIDSQNPPGQEARIAAFVVKFLRAYGLSVKTYEFRKKRTNVIAVLKGRHAQRSLLLSPHLDTVPAGSSWKKPPFGASLVGSKIYGLGATDCKGNLAVGMEVLASLSEDRFALPFNVIFAATADEESGSEYGLIPLLDKGILKCDAALILDADDFHIVIAQKGLMHVKFKVKGKKAHGAYPWRGDNAIERASAALAALKKHAFSYKANPYLREPTINIGTIRGGDKVNVVADWCEFELDFRFLPGSSAKKILAEAVGLMKKYAPHLSVEIEGIQEPYGISDRHPLVLGLSRAMDEEGKKVFLTGSEGATVITFFQHQGIPAVATGFGFDGCAHKADEFADANHLFKGARILERFLKNYTF